MAATICYPNLGLETKKLDAYLQCRDNRNYPAIFSSGVIRGSWDCGCPKTFHNTNLTWLGVKQPRRNWRTLFNSSSDIVNVEAKEDEISKPTLIWRAVKLPMYSVALVPLTVGSAAAFWQTGLFSAGQFLLLFSSSVLVIAWLNLRSR